MKLIQVLRDKIGTAIRNKFSRPDQFFLIMHGNEGEGKEKEVFLKKEGAMCDTPMCHSLTLGFHLPQSCCKDIYTVRKGRESHRKPPLKKGVPSYEFDSRISAAAIVRLKNRVTAPP